MCNQMHDASTEAPFHCYRALERSPLNVNFVYDDIDKQCTCRVGLKSRTWF